MARIRSVKPEIWMSPQVMNLTHSARLLFLGLITQADDEGRGTADPRRLKAAIFGGDDVTSTDVRRWLDEVSAQRLAVVYESPQHGLLYQLPSWGNHQSIDRPRKSSYPAPPPVSQSITCAHVSEDSSSVRRGLVGDRKEGKDLRKEGSEGERESAREPVPRGASAEIIAPSDPPARPLTAAQAFDSMLDGWRRDVPECNAEAFTRWIVHCELEGKRMNPNMRFMQARRLAGNGDAAAQREVVDWCIEQGYRTLVPVADVRARRDGRVASAPRKGDPPKRTWLPPDDNAGTITPAVKHAQS